MTIWSDEVICPLDEVNKGTHKVTFRRKKQSSFQITNEMKRIKSVNDSWIHAQIRPIFNETSVW